MSINTAIANARSVLTAALMACTFLTGVAAADSHAVTVAIKVSTQGINPADPAGARELYRRLDDAAWIACTRANRIGLEPTYDPRACADNSLADAIRSLHNPLLSMNYLETHSLKQAAAHGIELPVQASARPPAAH